MRRERITITLRKDVIKKVDAIIDGQKIRNRSNAIETILLEKLKRKTIQKAVILCSKKSPGVKIAGEITPKALFPIKEKTLLQRNIERLEKSGINEIIITDFGKWGGQIKKALEGKTSKEVDIKFVDSPGTAGILLKNREFFSDTFLMVNGDILLDTIDIQDMHYFHKKNNGLITICVATTTDPAQLGSIFMKGNLITDFKEKAASDQDQSHLINGGVYLIEPAALEFFSGKKTMLENDLFPKVATTGKLLGYQVGKSWVHLHDEKAYRKYITSS